MSDRSNPFSDGNYVSSAPLFRSQRMQLYAKLDEDDLDFLSEDVEQKQEISPTVSEEGLEKVFEPPVKKRKIDKETVVNIDHRKIVKPGTMFGGREKKLEVVDYPVNDGKFVQGSLTGGNKRSNMSNEIFSKSFNDAHNIHPRDATNERRANVRKINNNYEGRVQFDRDIQPKFPRLVDRESGDKQYFHEMRPENIIRTDTRLPRRNNSFLPEESASRTERQPSWKKPVSRSEGRKLDLGKRQVSNSSQSQAISMLATNATPDVNNDDHEGKTFEMLTVPDPDQTLYEDGRDPADVYMEKWEDSRIAPGPAGEFQKQPEKYQYGGVQFGRTQQILSDSPQKSFVNTKPWKKMRRITTDDFLTTKQIMHDKEMCQGKIPMIGLIITRIIKANPTGNIGVLLSDEEGDIEATMHKKLVKKYPNICEPGVVILLEDVTILQVAPKTYHLLVHMDSLRQAFNAKKHERKQ